MRLFVRVVSVLVVIVLLSAGAAWSAEALAPPHAPGSEPQPGAPAAQVTAVVIGEVISTDIEASTFRMATRPTLEQSPGIMVVVVNAETTMVKNQLLAPDQLAVGDGAKVIGKSGTPPALAVYGRGTVEAVGPLTLAVMEGVTLTVAPDADLQFVRVGPLTLAEMHQGMEVQALLVAGQEPAVGLEVHSFESLLPAAEAEAEPVPSAESTPE